MSGVCVCAVLSVRTVTGTVSYTPSLCTNSLMFCAPLQSTLHASTACLLFSSYAKTLTPQSPVLAVIIKSSAACSLATGFTVTRTSAVVPLDTASKIRTAGMCLAAFSCCTAALLCALGADVSFWQDA